MKKLYVQRHYIQLIMQIYIICTVSQYIHIKTNSLFYYKLLRPLISVIVFLTETYYPMR